MCVHHLQTFTSNMENTGRLFLTCHLKRSFTGKCYSELSLITSDMSTYIAPETQNGADTMPESNYMSEPEIKPNRVSKQIVQAANKIHEEEIGYDATVQSLKTINRKKVFSIFEAAPTKDIHEFAEIVIQKKDGHGDEIPSGTVKDEADDFEDGEQIRRSESG